MMWLWAFAVLGLIGLAAWVRRVQLAQRVIEHRVTNLEGDIADARQDNATLRRDLGGG